MRLSSLSESALRALLFLGVHRGRTVPLSEIARSYRMPRAELEEAERLLDRLGLVEVVDDGAPGVRLAVQPERINVGWLVRRTEPSLDIVECFDRATNTCPIAPACMLKNILHEARQEFLESLDRFTLADCLASPRRRLALVRFWSQAAGAAPDHSRRLPILDWTSSRTEASRRTEEGEEAQAD